MNRMWRWFEHSQIYRPSRELECTATEVGVPCEDIWFKAADGARLNAWFFPADAASPRARFVLLVCHGNGGNISHRVALCRALLRTGAAVMVFDYRGYGRSEGKLSEEGTYLDAQAAWGWLRQRGFAAQNIIAVGDSLGGAIATELALRETVGGLVLHGAFTSIADIGAERFPFLPVRWLHSIRYDTLGKLPRVRVPVLVLHGRNDETIHFKYGERNFAAANEPKIFHETSGDHNYSIPGSLESYVQGVEKLLALLEKTPNIPPSSPR
jgi:uncharacterized protein